MQRSNDVVIEFAVEENDYAVVAMASQPALPAGKHLQDGQSCLDSRIFEHHAFIGGVFGPPGEQRPAAALPGSILHSHAITQQLTGSAGSGRDTGPVNAIARGTISMLTVIQHG